MTLITPAHLAERWKLTPGTLTQWRWNGRGPHFIKLGRRVMYHIKDVEAFEAKKRCLSTTSRSSPWEDPDRRD